MKRIFTYNKKNMTLHICVGKYNKYLQCPFATWWKARKYFVRPKFKVYFGPMWKYNGKKDTRFGVVDDYKYLGGYWPAASTEYLKWFTSKWFPIHIMSSDIMWKDKFESPRYEGPGYFIIFFGRDYRKHWQFSIVVNAPKYLCNNNCMYIDHPENYWESMLWYSHYYKQYNPNYGVPSIFSARQSMRTDHWVLHEQEQLNDFVIIGHGKETLNMGNGLNKEFTYVDVKSEKLCNKIDENYEYSNDILRSDVRVSINIKVTEKHDEGEPTELKSYERSEYVKMYVCEDENKPEEETGTIVRLFFNDKKNEINELLDRECQNIKLNIVEKIDLGPAFKDDFLTKKAHEEIQFVLKER